MFHALHRTFVFNMLEIVFSYGNFNKKISQPRFFLVMSRPAQEVLRHCAIN